MRINKMWGNSTTIFTEESTNPRKSKYLKVVNSDGKTRFVVQRISDLKWTKNFIEASFPTYEEAVNEWNKDEPEGLAD